MRVFVDFELVECDVVGLGVLYLSRSWHVSEGQYLSKYAGN